jgi:hypothetical protein
MEQNLDQFWLNHSQQVRTHYQSREVAVFVPLAQAFVTGTLVSIIVSTAVWFVCRYNALAVLDSLGWALSAGFVSWSGVMLLTWRDRQREWRELIWNLERSFGVDIDGDGDKGEPQTARIEVSFRESRQQQTVELPFALSKMIWLAKAITAGTRKFTERDLSGAGNPFSVGEVDEMREVFIARGWLKWVNPDSIQQGVEWTAKGLAVLKGLADMEPPHPDDAGTARVYAFRTHAPFTHKIRRLQ